MAAGAPCLWSVKTVLCNLMGCFTLGSCGVGTAASKLPPPPPPVHNSSQGFMSWDLGHRAFPHRGSRTLQGSCGLCLFVLLLSFPSCSLPHHPSPYSLQPWRSPEQASTAV